MNETAILEVNKVGKRFGGFVALNDIDLSIRRGERVGLIGPNGSGKSTLTNCLCGAMRPDSGSVLFAGKSIDGMSAHDRAKLGMSRSFQLPRPFHSLSLMDNLRVPLKYVVNKRGGSHLSEEKITLRAYDLLEKFGLGGKAERLPRDLTQVEMRKLELARAMATEPALLVSDEAMAGLSNSEVDEILALLMALNREGVAIIFIEHIIRAVMAFSERLVVLVAGQKVADGLPKEVLANEQVVGAYLGE
ncbi:MAG: ABC transporter ATP-binding protein [Xanthobacteraceae bacterium]|nr:ABC transporter ATP-binding protein [Xanthobacteraceae bacterium]